MRATLCWWDICESIILEDPVDGSSGFECTALPATSTESNDISISTRRMHPRKRNIGFLLNLLCWVFLVKILAFILAMILTMTMSDPWGLWPLRVVSPCENYDISDNSNCTNYSTSKKSVTLDNIKMFNNCTFLNSVFSSSSNLRLRWNCVLSTHFFAFMRSQS